MAGSTIEVKIDGVEDMRRLSAALEQYNAGSRGDAAQIEALRAELDKVRKQLHREQNETTWAAAYIVGDPVPPRVLGKQCSLIETVAIEVRKQIDELRYQLAEALDSARAAELEQFNAEKRADELHAKRQEANDELAVALDRIHQLEQIHDQQVYALTFNRDQVETLQRESIREQAVTLEAIAMMEGRRTAQLNQTEVNNKLLREVSELMRALEQSRNHRDGECRQVREALGVGALVPVGDVIRAIDALQVDASMKQHTIEGLARKANDLEQQIAKAAPVESDKKLADALKMRLAEANDTITKQATENKDLHSVITELRRIVADRDDEIAAAEKFAAKYKPLIEAVRGGIAYGYWGKWVPINSVTVADMNDGTAVSLFIPNSEDPQCL